MSEEVLLLSLRLAGSLALLSFVGAIGLMLWRDYRQAAEAAPHQVQQHGRLVVMRSEIAETPVGQSWPLQPVTTLGRAPNNTIMLAEPFASNQHALVAWRDGQWWLEDLKSSNGTLLNGERVQEPTVLSSGDVIGFGRILLRLEIE